MSLAFTEDIVYSCTKLYKKVFLGFVINRFALCFWSML